RKPGDGTVACGRVGQDLGLALQRVEIRHDQRVITAGPGEEIAEAAPHLAERDVHVEKQRVAAFRLPQRPEWHGWVERAIRRLVRGRVRAADARTRLVA